MVVSRPYHSNQRYAGNRRPQGNIALIACLRGLADFEVALGFAKVGGRIRQPCIKQDIIGCPIG